jgi:hypothetical protein
LPELALFDLSFLFRFRFHLLYFNKGSKAANNNKKIITVIDEKIGLFESKNQERD